MGVRVSSVSSTLTTNAARTGCFLAAALAAAFSLAPLSAQGMPVVQVTSPVMNSEVAPGGSIPLAADASSPGSVIIRVEFFDDDHLVGSTTQAPFKLDYQPTAHKLNFRITARATDAAGHSALSPAVTCVATSNVQRRYKSYDYEETSETILKQVRLTIPEGLSVVRGILVVTNSSGGNSRDYFKEAWYGEFLYLHDFAFLGARGFDSHSESFQVMQHALQKIAEEANHPELVNVPYATTGFSAGGGFASRLLVEAPDRVIACVPCGARLNFTGVDPTSAMLHTPACIISGELEKNFPSAVEPVLATYRPRGAQYAWMTIQNASHARMGQEKLAMPLLDTVLRMRYPADADVRTGPVTLKPIDTESGWVADNTTWTSGLTTITAAKDFKGDIEKSSWLPSEDIAFIYRAYATYDKPISITSPETSWSQAGIQPSVYRAWDPGSNVTIVVDDTRFPGWKKLEFYDDARKLGEITQGPPQFTAMNLQPGYHAFSILGTDAQGNLRTSNPVLVVVRKLPTTNLAH